MLIGYAEDSTLLSVVLSLGFRVTVAESLNRDLGKVSERCDLCGMKLNASKTKTIIVSRSRTMNPHLLKLLLLIKILLLRSIIVQFPEQLLKGLVS